MEDKFDTGGARGGVGLADGGPNFRSDLLVDLVAAVGSDDSVVQSARVSVVGGNERPTQPEEAKGLINYLVRQKHGSPFEHNQMTFYVNAPIFVAREFMRHRIGWSYNELSLRYSEASADFYVPSMQRPLVNEGTSAKPELVQGTNGQFIDMTIATQYASNAAWTAYQNMLYAGIAREVARGVLGTNVYTEFYATANARSIMNFLSLRTQHEGANHKSRPQWEIAQVADEIEGLFALHFPITYEAYNKYGRVAP